MDRRKPGVNPWQHVRRCLVRGLRLGLAALLGIGVGLVGCSDPVTKYRVLSFFFDGVPLPPGMEGASTQPGGPGARTRGTQASRPKDLPIFTHQPYKDRLCAECHSGQRGYQVAVPKDVCQKCHSSYFKLQPGDWIHGPVLVGGCGMCHAPHTANYDGLLTKSQSQLCFWCHSASRVLSAPYHVEAEKRRCSDCHDPHSAGNRLLLADSTTYRRRRSKMKTLPSAHSKWGRETCATCHLVKQSYRLMENADRRCLSCHEKVIQSAPGRLLHKPVREGKCPTCHTPHNSVRPHLIKAGAEKLCMPCHKEEDLRKLPRHPIKRRADCLLCHKGHSYPDDHLLAPGRKATTRTAAAKGPRPKGPAEKRP